jgi:hypothetical protein
MKYVRYALVLIVLISSVSAFAAISEGTKAIKSGTSTQPIKR